MLHCKMLRRRYRKTILCFAIAYCSLFDSTTFGPGVHSVLAQGDFQSGSANLGAPKLLQPKPNLSPQSLAPLSKSGPASQQFWRPAVESSESPAGSNSVSRPNSMRNAADPTFGSETSHGFYPSESIISSNVGSEDPTLPSTASSADRSQESTPQWIREAITEGSAMAKASRWNEALSVYQSALRKSPESGLILEHRQNARIHVDLTQRLADSLYVNYALTDSPEYALASYNEVLSKIHAYHVEQPDWNRIAHHGVDSLLIAFENTQFQEKFGGTTFLQTQKAIAQTLRTNLQDYQIMTRMALLDLVRDIARLAEEKCGLRQAVTIHEFASSAISALDTYSNYLSPGQFEDLTSQIRGNFVGIGVELRSKDDCLEIVKVIPGGPADQARIRGGDKLLAVNGQKVVDIGGDQAADLLKGGDGSQLTVVVQTPDDKQYRLRMQRRQIDIPSVETAKIIDKESGIAYLKLANFQKNTVQEFDNAMQTLNQNGMKALVLDLRDNPGGVLDVSVTIANRFLNGGVIVSTKGRNPLENAVHPATSTYQTWNTPLVVLINENSASASEILAAAIADHKRGAIVGQKSFGKGSVQGIFPLSSGRGGVRLTTAKYYSPNGRKVDLQGVSPDFNVQVTAKVATDGSADRGSEIQPTESDSDAILNAGIRIAKRQLPNQTQPRVLTTAATN